MLSQAEKHDMPTNWSFNWLNLWKNTDFECQNIVKLVYNNEIWGLVRYGLYPYPGIPCYLEIEQLEAHPISRGKTAKRFIEPIGKWLIWYTVKVALKFCKTELEDPLIVLVALDTAMSYYSDKVQMEYLGTATIAPGEDGCAFRFLRNAAVTFCDQQESLRGVPKLYGQQ
ncbi:hypothetical protein [Dendronalium phyllosphericum]|nr:hypothetical protein [Dendronalium phyllosphericum]